ncbi:MAG: hypothetical protein J6F30_12265 [Cellulosilyticum sp.]|nr:hypothetical protein [Cellulosilyticum sp.]
MIILKEWLESDLLLLGLIIWMLSILYPWKNERNKLNYVRILGCIIVYIISEVIMRVTNDWGVTFILLFVGGVSLSIAFGRVVKMLWKKIRIRNQ